MDLLVRQQLSRASELLADAAQGRPDTRKQPNIALAIDQAFQRGVRRSASGGPDVDALDRQPIPHDALDHRPPRAHGDDL